MLTKEQILAKAVGPSKEVTVPEWDGSVLLIAISGSARIDLQQRLREVFKNCVRDEKGAILDTSSVDRNESRAINFTLLSLTIAGADRGLLFTEDELKEMSYTQEALLQRLAVEAFELNGFGSGAVEAEAKKSEASPSDS